ncbi:cytochrome B [Rhodohalobacter sp.]|uniref:cytochrome B n=1 Tax=Rhodohalobacter sp. TaxID=1974210 RepID=UPI002ACEAB89|nr:cytochrome B [Rhodohalobacter sp.]MDZ7757046.1 cytochrome B [Rhodohalobacter sp.]
MYTGLKHLHSYLAYLLLAALVFSIIYVIIQFVGKKSFTEKVRKVTLIGFIATHLQLLIGLVLYVISPVGLSNFSGEAMSESLSRLYILEHPLTMLIAIVLVSVGYIKAKKPGDDARRFRTVIIYYGLGLILMLSRIPWSEWL